MKPKNRKSVLITILILLGIFIPLAIIGTTTHFKNRGTNESVNNSNHDLYYNGKLYFYDSDNLLGTYTCNNKICDYAYETNDDEEYGINYYKDDSLDQIHMINNKYAFIIDTDAANITDGYGNVPVTLYDIEKEGILSTFKAVKNYTIGIENSNYIVQNNEGLWGVISFENNIKVIIPYSYNYIGLHKGSTPIKSNIFVVLDNTGWKLVDNTNNDLTISFNNVIFDYNERIVITKDNDNYYIYNYQGEPSFPYGFKDIQFIDNFIGVITNEGEFQLLHSETLQELSSKYPVNSMDDVSYEMVEDGLELSINGNVVETIRNS